MRQRSKYTVSRSPCRCTSNVHVDGAASSRRAISVCATIRRNGGQDGVGLERRIAGEVHTRVEVPQQPAHEDAEIDVRRVARVRRRRTRVDGIEGTQAGRIRFQPSEQERAGLHPRATSPPSHPAPARPRRRSPGSRGGCVRRRRPDRPARPSAVFVVRPNEKNGPTVCDGVATSGTSHSWASAVLRRRSRARLEWRRVSAAQDDVEAVAERPLRLGQREIEPRDHAAAGPTRLAPTGTSDRTRTTGPPESTSA